MTKTNLNIEPYYDDYTESKKFHKILFRPAYAVQARELTQAQTILQNQIERFGNHMFKNGAMVIPGQITYNSSLYYVKVNTQYSNVNIDYATMIGHPITGQTSNVKGTVIAAVGEEINADGGTDPVTLIVSYDENGADDINGNAYNTFLATETLAIQVDNETTLFATVVGAGDGLPVTGKASMSFINPGVYYIDGYFVIVDGQNIILEKYSSSPSYRVGLLKTETLITEVDDASLSDNAQGYPNYAAPGAHRLKIDLLLSKLPLDSDNDENFIELHRIDAGVLISETRRTEYAELEKTLARRTYDESGDYTVDPFICTVQEHFKDDNANPHPLYAEGKYVADTSPSYVEGAPVGDMSKLVFNLDPGKAYVKGFEISTISYSQLVTNKARTTDTVFNELVFTKMGNYILMTNVTGWPKLSPGDNFEEVSLKDAISGAGNVIGTANVKFFYRKNSTQFILGLFNIQMNSGKYFSNVMSVVGGELQGDCVQVNSQTMLYDTDLNSLVFPLTKQFVKGMTSSRLTYSVMRTAEGVVSDGDLTISGVSGEVFNTNTNLVMVIDNADNAILSSNDYEITIDPTNNLLTVTVAAGTYTVMYPVTKTTRPRTKTYALATMAPTSDIGASIELDDYDVFEITSIVDSNGDITDRYILDDGQRDNYYAKSTIKRKKGAAAPSGAITISYTYLDPGATGDYFAANSYVFNDIDHPGFFYEDIPSYRDDRLSDAIDFRPTGSVLTTSNVELPIRNDYISCSYEFYLGRIDYIILNSQGVFSIVTGEPSEFPKPPDIPADSMALYKVDMFPYTVSRKAIGLNFIENKRYTMRDIGRLEKRIQNLEYYSTLNMLEKDTSEMQITDSAGYDRFKNGFIVDPFTSHGIGDITRSDYRCAIDPKRGMMRPKFHSKSVALEFNDKCRTNSTGYKKTGDLILLNYTEVPFINQPYASRTENVNPHSVRVFKGEITFYPDSDNWYDTKKVGELIVNDDANYKALQFIANNAEGLNGVTWNDWKTDWTSEKSTSKELDKDQGDWELAGWDFSRQHTSKDRNGNVIWSSDESGMGNRHMTRETTVTTQTTTTTTKGMSRTGKAVSFEPKTVKKDLGNRTVGMNYIPYMREKYIVGFAKDMKPNTRVWPFFDDESVLTEVRPLGTLTYTSLKEGQWWDLRNATVYGKTSGATAVIRNVDITGLKIYISDITGTFSANEPIYLKRDNSWVANTTVYTAPPAWGTDPDDNTWKLFTDSKGAVAFEFHIVGGKWKTGERIFLLNDQWQNVQANNTMAQGKFKSQGSTLLQENTVLSTKTIEFSKRNLSDNKVVKSTDISINKTTEEESAWVDPVAQTIMIEEPGGCFITGMDIFFYSKDPTLPIILQLREVDNGYPSSKILPFGQVSLEPEYVNISDDASVATRFTFESPVYMKPKTEYAFVLMSDSFEYNIWISHLGDKEVGTERLISSQPYLGVMFKSQNSTTWNADQDEDIKFTVYKARFTSSEATLYFQNAALPEVTLNRSPFMVDPNNTIASGIGATSNVVRVFQAFHGMSEGGYVTIADKDASDLITGLGNITAANMKGEFKISNVEFNSFDITVAGTHTAQAMFGNWAKCTQDAMMDTACIDIQHLLFPETGVSWMMNVPNGRSVGDLAGTQDPYTYADNVWISYSNNENIEFSAPRAVYSATNEYQFLRNSAFPFDKSLAVKATLTTTNANISPVIDITRMQCITVNNLVDKFETQDYVNTVAFTVENNDELELTFPASHGLYVDNYINISLANDPTENAADLTNDTFFEVKGTANAYLGWTINNAHKIISRPSATKIRIQLPAVGFDLGDSAVADDCVVTVPTVRHKMFLPETESEGGTTAAKYITKKITLANPSIAFTCLFSASVQAGADVQLYYRTLKQYDKETPLDNLDYTLARMGMADEVAPNGDEITFVEVPKSLSSTDFKDYELTVECKEPFVEISGKLVMTSENTSKPPIVKDFRLVVLGT